MTEILFISRWFPWPADNGSKLRILNLLRGLSEKYEITLLSFVDQGSIDTNRPEIRSLCREVKIVPLKTFVPNGYTARIGFLNKAPRSIIDTFSLEMAQCIQDVISIRKPKLIIASQLASAAYHRYFCGLPALFEEVESGLLYDRFTNTRPIIAKFRNGLTWVKYRSYLSNLVSEFQAMTVVSNKEKELLDKLNQGKINIEIIPNCININDYLDFQEIPEPNTLIFAGSFKYYPNYEAMIWFLDKVFPLIQSQIPSTKLFITGDHENRPLPEAPNVIKTGFIKDVRPLLAKSWASVVPILSGGGTRLKILEAMALHTPVVSTIKGAEGLNVCHNTNILISDSPIEFANNVIQLLSKPDLRQKFSDNGFQLVRREYEWSIVIPRLINLIEKTIQSAN